jgi:hypothetical protein
MPLPLLQSLSQLSQKGPELRSARKLAWCRPQRREADASGAIPVRRPGK